MNDFIQKTVKCEMCGADAIEDGVEGFCPVCGNGWTIDEDLFEDRINYEMGREGPNEDPVLPAVPPSLDD